MDLGQSGRGPAGHGRGDEPTAGDPLVAGRPLKPNHFRLVAALIDLSPNVLEATLVQRPRLPDRRRAPVQRANPLQQLRAPDGFAEVLTIGDRAVVGHQRGTAALERIQGDLGQFVGAKVLYSGHADRAAEGYIE